MRLVSTDFSIVQGAGFVELIHQIQGISFGEEFPVALVGTPAVEEKTGSGKVAVEAGDTALSELEARLNNLKR